MIELIATDEQLYAACCTVDRFYLAIDLTMASFPEAELTPEQHRAQIIQAMLFYWPPSGSC